MAKKKVSAAAKQRKAKENAEQNETAPREEQEEERPFIVRMLTVGVASYLAHKVWTKRKTLSEGWYTEEQSETQGGMVTVFEYLSSMGLIFVMGIVRESVAPSPTKQSKKKGGTASQPKKKKKRPRESVATSLVQSQKKRKQQLETLLDELETQVQEQCEELIADAERRAQELEMELKVQLLFLPEAVRQMPWRTFVEDFGGDLQNVTHSFSMQQTQSPVQSPPPQTRSGQTRHSIVAATPGSGAEAEDSADDDGGDGDDGDFQDTRNRRLSAFETPMDRRRQGEVPRTVLRTARKGETTYSVRGSPILPDTVAKAPAGSLVATFDGTQEPSTCLRLDSERILDLSRPEELSAESRGEATSKLQALQAKVAQLLRQINPYAS
ncbi:hypothetical protein BBJ29_002686 [Phytophthora kernoviae]|uniref:Uncharacterized protein n=1 Tax=Phytophthora kernoviae TaxID=325452 RepID=A0A3F2RRN7_9STRA|nr:hypothetical protein BBP00_00004470 [Phytophthora kernoviae]RLN68391.1 hypothetical protein BBJ29_002686 [Phytophthora kernoviae]